MLEIERKSTGSDSMESWLYKRLWTCRKTMNEWMNEWCTCKLNKNLGGCYVYRFFFRTCGLRTGSQYTGCVQLTHGLQQPLVFHLLSFALWKQTLPMKVNVSICFSRIIVVTKMNSSGLECVSVFYRFLCKYWNLPARDVSLGAHCTTLSCVLVHFLSFRLPVIPSVLVILILSH
jgi:hypothetical protein